MELVKLSYYEFEQFTNNTKQESFYQTLDYARFLGENGYEYDFIGLKDRYNNIRAASLIAFNKITNNYYYGYAPGGFIIDYNDIELVKDFSKALNQFYKKKNVVFIKIIPNIIIAKLNKVKNCFIENDSIKIIDNFKKAKFQPLKNNLYFESILPKYRPIVNLKNIGYNNLNKNIRNKIRKCYRKGLHIEKGSFDNIKDIYPFIKNKTKNNIEYYENLFYSFGSNNKIDIFLVSVNFEEYLVNMQDQYDLETQKNNILIKKVQSNPTEKNLDQKMQSDKELLSLKNNIVIATNGLANGPKKYIAGALVIKHNDEVIIFESGYDNKYKECNPNHFLNYKIMEYYKYNYNYLDMNGFSGDLSKDNPYYGVNEFKLGFKPDVYETIGEFDIVFNKGVYKKLISNGTLANLFNKNRS